MSGGFLGEMAALSRARCQAARALCSRVRLEAQITQSPDTTLPLTIDQFGVIAEVKRRSPAIGDLDQHALSLEARVDCYAKHGAAAISVLTEPARFNGALQDVALARPHAVSVPLMRKDFIVDEYQILEGRINGASGVLLIVRMLDAKTLRECLKACQDLKMFVLLECFDTDDINQLNSVLDVWQGPLKQCLIGINSRDLTSLQVNPLQLERLVSKLPSEYLKVAESGLETPNDAQRLSQLGYDLALVGTALMRSSEPGRLLVEMTQAGQRGVQARQ